MCNVPELAMCYYVDAIVQSYEIIKTEGPNDDIVTLYDLTKLCETARDDNLYTLPVAILLYKMRHNIVLKFDYEKRLKESGTIGTLLKHYLDILDPKKFPEYYRVAEYMIAELLVDDNSSELNWICDEITILNTEVSKDTLSFKNEKEQTSNDID
ncbi:unnamed protein product [Rotaria sordida]|uniref:EDRF1 N-terminal domain-containing protein n=1 Tax=Rotaria sordida TaxID=392033 RepID=A0A819C787_9BILA|nr:unnamed protein product [Rotaria sordida]CAF3814615.1 unnamed protein product [Rotaria sordida]CAF4244711.1 unnamed protein product [Rotaria sordida]